MMKTLSLALCLCGLSITLSAQSNYSNIKYGISLRFPNTYDLKGGDLGQEDPGLGYLGPIPMEFIAPGGFRLVTVEAPKGSYPGTDFVNAFFTVSINQHLTRDECWQFPNDLSRSREHLAKRISSVQFQGLQLGDAGLGHQFTGVYYHGFSNGSCYELGYGLATAGYGAVDGMKQVNRGEVFSILERILGTVVIRAPKTGAAADASGFADCVSFNSSGSNKYLRRPARPTADCQA